MVRRAGQVEGMKSQEAWEGMRADYAAAKVSRFRRRRTGISSMGSGADYHYRNESDFLRIMEYARDMDRNDAIVGQMVDRAVQNIIQGGLTPDPKTGDPELDKQIKLRWADWASDARQCSVDGELVYRDLEKLALRQMFVDGDDFTLLGEEGDLQLIEAHRCRTPQRTRQNCVHGVLMDDQRKRLQYWFTKEDIDPMMAVARMSDITPVEAFDADGYRNVLHLRNIKRVTQTRSVSAFAPVFDLLGMHEDLQFAKLVQQQVTSCIGIIRNRDANFKGGAVDAYGANTTDTWATTAQRRLIEEISPGMELRGLPGEQISGFSPNVPNAEFFQQMRTILQLIGINLGMPLVLLLMDASDTNFSGWRGAMDQARMGFRDMQQHMIDHWECPIYLWKLRQWAREDSAMRARLPVELGGGARTTARASLLVHEWNAPRWPYIQPLQDSQADQLRQEALQSSPRRIHGGLAQDWNDVIDETVEDNGYAILKAAEKAKELNGKPELAGANLTWREVLFLINSEMLKLSTASAVASAPPGGADAGPVSLNGAQITSLVDVVGKLRSGVIAAEAALELLVATGIERVRAQAVVKATGEGTGKAAEGVEYLRKLLLAFSANPNVLPLVVNSVKVGPVVEGAGVPQNKEYDEPYLPVQVPAGQSVVTGAVLKDGDGSIVGGVAEGGTAPGAATTENTGGAEGTGGADGGEGDKVTGGQGEGDTGEAATPAKKDAAQTVSAAAASPGSPGASAIAATEIEREDAKTRRGSGEEGSRG